MSESYKKRSPQITIHLWSLISEEKLIFKKFMPGDPVDARRLYILNGYLSLCDPWAIFADILSTDWDQNNLNSLNPNIIVIAPHICSTAIYTMPVTCMLHRKSYPLSTEHGRLIFTSSPVTFCVQSLLVLRFSAILICLPDTLK